MHITSIVDSNIMSKTKDQRKKIVACAFVAIAALTSPTASAHAGFGLSSLLDDMSDGVLGASGGAALGALAGQLIGKDTESTMIGTAVGGLGGYIVGNEMDKSATTEEINRARQNTPHYGQNRAKPTAQWVNPDPPKIISDGSNAPRIIAPDPPEPRKVIQSSKTKVVYKEPTPRPTIDTTVVKSAMHQQPTILRVKGLGTPDVKFAKFNGFGDTFKDNLKEVSEDLTNNPDANYKYVIKSGNDVKMLDEKLVTELITKEALNEAMTLDFKVVEKKKDGSIIAKASGQYNMEEHRIQFLKDNPMPSYSFKQPTNGPSL